MTLTLPPDKSAARRVVRTARRRRRADTTASGWDRLGEQLAHGLASWLAGRPGPGLVAIYEALPTEPPTLQVGACLAAAGARLIVPVLLESKDLSWRDLGSGADLGPDAVADADLVITPGLAVARDTGLRLGQGGGSYDRALSRVRVGTPVVTMLFDEELVQRVPAEPHDRPVGAVLTPGGGVRAIRSAV